MYQSEGIYAEAGNLSKFYMSWRKPFLARLELTLTVFDLVLSAVFFVVSAVNGNIYFRGVAVGLLIAGVTSGIAYLFKTRMVKPDGTI